MGFRYRKSFKIGKGSRFNVNKKSVGVSFGVKGARVSLNSRGRKTTTVGIPGSGLYYTDTSQIGSKKRKLNQSVDQFSDYEDIALPTYNEYSGKKGFSWTILLFGPFPALFRGQFMLFICMLFFDAGLALAFGIYAYIVMNFFFACLYNRMVFGRLLQKLMKYG